MHGKWLAIIGAAALLFSARIAAADKIVEIEIKENSKTREETVRFIAGVDEGDEFSYTLLDEIRVDLVSSGLFKDVEVYSTPVATGVKLTIVARDKHSWIIAPTVYRQPTNKGGGVGFGENNLFGANKKLLLYGQIATGDSFFVGAYVDPSINDTRFHWQYDVLLKRERVIEYSIPDELLADTAPTRQSKLNYLNSGATFGFKLFRSASFDWRIRGAHVSYDDPHLVEGGDPLLILQPAGTPGVVSPGGEGWDVSTSIGFNLDRRANWYGIQSGNRYRVVYEKALPDLGSDFRYSAVTFDYTRARRYLERHNFVLRVAGGYGWDVPFQQEFTAGGTRLRGYKNAQFRGNLMLGGNAEYSVPLFGIGGFSMRALGFWDTSYVTFRDIDPDRTRRNYLVNYDEGGVSPWKNAVGGGVRMYLRQIVLPLLGLDVGYGLERKSYEIYFAIGLTD